MLELKSFEDQVRDLYRFFVSAEMNNEEVTYEQIQEKLVDRTYDTVVWYANNFWSWFLSKKKERRGRYRVFVCRGLVRYPEDFFVAAHINSQGKYFYHFGGALDASRERARLRKQTKEQPDQPELPIEAGQREAGQEFPETLHIADNETEEIEVDEQKAHLLQTSTAFPSREPASFAETTQSPPERPLSDLPVREGLLPEGTSIHEASLISPGRTIIERIADMLSLSKRDRETLDQLHQAVERLVQAHAQEQARLRSEIAEKIQTEIRGLQQTLLAQIEDQFKRMVPSQAEWLQLHSDTVSQVQDVKREQAEKFARTITVLTEEIRRLPAPPDLAPLRADLASQQSYLEQTLMAAIQQLPVPPDLAAISQILTEVIQQLPVPPGLAAIHMELERSAESLQKALLERLQQPYAIPELSQVAISLDQLVGELAQRASVPSNGRKESIDPAIRNVSDQARKTIDALENVYIAWIETLQQQLQAMQQEQEEARESYQHKVKRSFQTLSEFVSFGKQEPPGEAEIAE